MKCSICNWFKVDCCSVCTCSLVQRWSFRLSLQHWSDFAIGDRGYIEHYGLQRIRSPTVDTSVYVLIIHGTQTISAECCCLNWVTSDHHAYTGRKYPSLRRCKSYSLRDILRCLVGVVPTCMVSGNESSPRERMHRLGQWDYKSIRIGRQSRLLL